MQRRRARTLGLVLTVLPALIAVAHGCSAGNDSKGAGGLDSGFGGSPTSSSSQMTGGKGGGTGGTGGGLVLPDSGPDAPEEMVVNPCGTACGDTELCDPNHLGLDDNCDYKVDEGCSCVPGQAHFCFKGDPSYRGTAGCYDGTEKCTEQGVWGPCVGGVHATPEDKCYDQSVTNCHPISTRPFVDIDLKTGTGAFSSDEVTETFTVTCPAGVTPCPTPGPTPPSNYKPLQSGEYSVLYQKTTGDGGMSSCTYPLFVGAPGLRIELQWEHPDPGGVSDGVDLDLHVHKPGDTSHWGMQGQFPADCTWANCVIGSFGSGSGPHWFPDTNMVPDPVNWFLDTAVLENNTCYFDPRGVGQTWQDHGMGCHNPRLDSDNIDCDSGETDSNAYEFCAPENINIDFPPKAVWTRVGVYYYGSHGKTYDVHPEIKIYCNGSLAADLGSTVDPNNPALRVTSGYDAPVTFQPAQGAIGNVFWEVADVLFPDSQCSTTQCIVQPLFKDEVAKTPYFTPGTMANGNFGPAYPPVPP